MYNTTCIQDNWGRAQYADYTLNDIPGTATNYLKTLAYGNGDGVKYDYDNQGRVITEEYGKNITSDGPPIKPNTLNTDDMLSIALSKADHKKYTAKWRTLRYSVRHVFQNVLKIGASIYSDNPKLMAAFLLTMEKLQ